MVSTIESVSQRAVRCRRPGIDLSHDSVPVHPALPPREDRDLPPGLEASRCGAHTLRIDASLRVARATTPASSRPVTGATAARPFSVHTAHNGTDLPGDLVRAAGDPASGDLAVDEAYVGVEASLALSTCSAPRRRVNVCSGWTPKRRVWGSRARNDVAPLTCATHGPVSTERATSAIAASGTQIRTSSASGRSSTARARADERSPPSRRGRRR